MNKIVVENSSISLESQLEMMAIEAVSVADITQTFRGFIPGMTRKLSDLASSLSGVLGKGEIADVVAIRSLTTHIKERQQYLNYSKLSHMLVPAPEGFKGDISDYLDATLELHPTVYAGINNLLSEYVFILSRFLSDKDIKKSIGSHNALYKQSATVRGELQHKLDRYFNPNNHSSRVKLSSYMDRIADIDDLSDRSIRLAKAVNSESLQNISRDVDRAVELLTMVELASGRGELAGASPEALLDLSNGAYELAKNVESISAFRFKNLQLLASIKTTLGMIKE